MKIKHWILLSLSAAIIFSSCGQTNTKDVKLTTKMDTLSYAIGADFGSNLKNFDLNNLNYDAFVNGLKDRIDENELKLAEEEIRPFIQAYITNLREEKAQNNLEEGRAFLEENKAKEGIITTESGLQYEVLEEGTGKSPEETDIVRCHYHGTLIDGTVFDSSVERGDTAEFALNRVIPGWTEGLQLMKEGAKYKFYIPSELGYGQRAPRGIEPNAVLIFEVELFEVKSPETKN